MSNYESTLEQQNEELKNRLARAEEQLASYRSREGCEVGTLKLVYKDWSGAMSMQVIDASFIRDNPQLLVHEVQKMVDELEYRTRMRPLMWTSAKITPEPITIAGNWV